MSEQQWRTVEVFERRHVAGAKWETVSLGLAVFHQWGIDHEEYQDGPGNFTTAIVEFGDGTVRSVPAERVKFQHDKMPDETPAEPIDPAEDEIGLMCYRGNSVAYMYDKARCYGDQVHMAFEALRALGFDSAQGKDNNQRRELLASFVERQKNCDFIEIFTDEELCKHYERIGKLMNERGMAAGE